MDKDKTPDTDEQDKTKVTEPITDASIEKPAEQDVGAAQPEGKAAVNSFETIETAPLSFISRDEEVPATTVINNHLPVQPEPEPLIKVASHCHVGAVRERNEDSCVIFTSKVGGHFEMMPFALYIVADGMGGHTNGHIASKTASRVVARDILKKIYLPLLEDNKNNQTPIQEVMADAVRDANTTIYELDDSDSGTTLTTALVFGRRLHVAHVGDSRIYMFADDHLEMVTEDHSLVHRLQEVGQLSAEEATVFQYRHVLLRALGQTEEVEADTFMRLLPKQGKLMLCSDGLCGFVPDDLIETFLRQDVPVEETADLLLNAALEAGGYDNITVIVSSFQF